MIRSAPRLALGSSDGIALTSIDGGEPQWAPGSQPRDFPLRWTKDGQELFIGNRVDGSCSVSRPNVQTGARTPWKTFSPSELAGVVDTECPFIAADEQHYVFGYRRISSDLFLVEHPNENLSGKSIGPWGC